MSIIAINKNLNLSDLDSWGSFSNLGAEILDGGDVQAFGRSTHGAPTDAISAGYFGTEKGRYRLVYPFSEQATLLSGEVKMIDEGTGASHHFRAGDTWFVSKGTSTVWEVVSDGYTKHYLSFI